jgi:catechol 2,3-dioxygenase-like lactoylglutathione lyase family enzyme
VPARFNHVSIPSSDLDASVRFYVEVFGLHEVPAPLFGGLPVRWLQAGDRQLHLFHSEVEAHPEQHLSFDVDDFEAFYWNVRERGITDAETFGSHLRRHPAGWLQLYLRDPCGNLIEVNWPDADVLSDELLAESVDLDELVPQAGAAATATLYTAVDA